MQIQRSTDNMREDVWDYTKSTDIREIADIKDWDAINPIKVSPEH